MILPDYQGIGLGYKFLTIVAQYYERIGFEFSIVTSAKNLIVKLAKSDQWTMTALDVTKPSTKRNAIDYKRESMRKKSKTGRFKYKRGSNSKE